jgi:hypothetical protein
MVINAAAQPLIRGDLDALSRRLRIRHSTKDVPFIQLDSVE